jgi:hypothetical protein
MKTIQQRQFKNSQKFKSYIVPVFLPEQMEQVMAAQTNANTAHAELSIFDVKELYDLAYDIQAQNGDDSKFKQILSEAVKLDMAYRRQLAQKAEYKDHKELKSFETASKSIQVA